MYLQHFKLREPPFQLTPDADFLYLSETHARAKAYMDYCIRARDGFVVITGEVGAGKTTLIRKLLSEFDQRVTVAKIFQTQLNELEFLQAVLLEFGIKPFHAGKVEVLNMLREFLLDNFARGRQAVLIVDEAQNLSPGVLEEVRMLSGLETQKQKILQVILVGQPELNATLDAPQMQQLLQRVRLRFHLRALSESETRDYIRHRLHIAGCERALFADDTVPAIYQYTGGIPRLINTLCDTAMMCAFADDLSGVTRATVMAAVDELQWPLYSRRVHAVLAPPAVDMPVAELAAKTTPASIAAPAAAMPAVVGANAHTLPVSAGSARTELADSGEPSDPGTTISQGLSRIEVLLKDLIAVLQRKDRRISVRFGRAQLMQLAKYLSDARGEQGVRR